MTGVNKQLPQGATTNTPNFQTPINEHNEKLMWLLYIADQRSNRSKVCEIIEETVQEIITKKRNYSESICLLEFFYQAHTVTNRDLLSAILYEIYSRNIYIATDKQKASQYLNEFHRFFDKKENINSDKNNNAILELLENNKKKSNFNMEPQLRKIESAIAFDELSSILFGPLIMLFVLKELILSISDREITREIGKKEKFSQTLTKHDRSTRFIDTAKKTASAAFNIALASQIVHIITPIISGLYLFYGIYKYKKIRDQKNNELNLFIEKGVKDQSDQQKELSTPSTTIDKINQKRITRNIGNKEKLRAIEERKALIDVGVKFTIFALAVACIACPHLQLVALITIITVSALQFAYNQYVQFKAKAWVEPIEPMRNPSFLASTGIAFFQPKPDRGARNTQYTPSQLGIKEEKIPETDAEETRTAVKEHEKREFYNQ